MAIRRCETRDREAVLRLLETNGLPVSDLRGAALERFVVCELAGEVCGVAGLEPYGENALLRSVAVRESARGAGIGGALIDAVESAARAVGFHALYLFTTTAADYFALRGWVVVDRETVPDAVKLSAEFSEICPASSTCMVKSLVRYTGR